MNLHYSREALNDLQRLRAFIAEKNPAAAANIANELVTGIRQLTKFPEIGLPVQRAPAPSQIRDLFIGKHTARYYWLITKLSCCVSGTAKETNLAFKRLRHHQMPNSQFTSDGLPGRDGFIVP